MKKFLKKISLAVLTLIVSVGTFIYPTPVGHGATLPQATALFETSLSSGISATDTSFNLSSNTVRGGGSISGFTCFTIDEGSAQAEVACGLVSSLAVTSVTRGISYADGVTSMSANKYSHRRGANVKITDYPLIQILKAQNNGDQTIPNAIRYDSNVTPSDLNELADVGYVLSVVTGGNITLNKLTVSGTAGENVSTGNLLYLSTNGKWYKSSATTIANISDVILGIAQGNGSTDGLVNNGIMIHGMDTNNTGTAGAYAYATDTAGTIGTTAGTYSKIVGMYLPSNDGMYFDKDFYLMVSQGTYGSHNKLLTQDQVYNSDTDQTQTTQNGVSEVGEASTTTKKNKIAQSFIPLKTKIRGVTLYKTADTGTFTGTVTVTLEANSSGSPSGTPLATRTITNAEWLAMPVGVFDANFSSEYQSLIQGDLYWITISASTADNTNHPNIGLNTAGGYANGSSKYYNTSDGWTTNPTVDLYFKTLQGVSGQLGSPMVQVFTQNGTYVKPTGAKLINVKVWGAGGSGASVPTGVSNARGGGGGGSYFENTFVASDVGSSEVITVGAGGTSVSGNSSGNGGGSSSFGSKITAYGGAGGSNANNSSSGGGGGGIDGSGNGNTGGAPTASSNSFGGSNGGSSNYWYGGGGGGNTDGSGNNVSPAGNARFGGGGGGHGGTNGNNQAGTSMFGGNGGVGSGSGNGTSGSVRGGGGGGSTGGTSGAGGRGEVIITTYF